MKVAFAIDFLVERTPEVFLLELLLAGFDDADIYCLAHAQGKILGRIETHRIHSTPLGRLVQNSADLQKRSWMLPSFVKTLTVAPDVDKLIILSSGWSHLIKSHPKTERYVWCNQLRPENLKLKGWKSVFSFYHEDLKKKGLLAEKNLKMASSVLAKKIGRDLKVVYPGIKTHDYPIIPDDQHPGEYPHHLVILTGANPSKVREIFVEAKKANINIKCVGRDEEYAEEKALKDPQLEFIGDHCAATTAAFTHAARAVWILGQPSFPTEALGALCCGRPVVVADLPHYREVLPADGVWFEQGNVTEIFKIANRDFLSADKKQMRRAGLKFNERLFKNQMRIWAGIRPVKEE